MAIKVPLTSEDFELIARRREGRFELIRGELYELSPVSYRHGEVAVQTSRKVSDWNDAARAGHVGVDGGFTLELRPDTVRAPDVFFVRKNRVEPAQKRKGFPHLAPDLIVEVRSPGDSWQYLVDKAHQFFDHGTLMAWLIQPDEFVEVWRPGQEPRRFGAHDLLDGGDVLPGFSCRVGDLFPEDYDD